MAARYEAELIITQTVRDAGERTATERELAAYVDDVAPGARTLVRAGDDPARQMADIARDEKIDVIVVGSVGMSGRKEFLLENIPNRVSHLARCTVVIVQTQLEGGKRCPRPRSKAACSAARRASRRCSPNTACARPAAAATRTRCGRAGFAKRSRSSGRPTRSSARSCRPVRTCCHPSS